MVSRDAGEDYTRARLTKWRKRPVVREALFLRIGSAAEPLKHGAVCREYWVPGPEDAWGASAWLFKATDLRDLWIERGINSPSKARDSALETRHPQLLVLSG
jgi:hypothetical protein